MMGAKHISTHVKVSQTVNTSMQMPSNSEIMLQLANSFYSFSVLKENKKKKKHLRQMFSPANAMEVETTNFNLQFCKHKRPWKIKITIRPFPFRLFIL